MVEDTDAGKEQGIKQWGPIALLLFVLSAAFVFFRVLGAY